MIGARPGPPAGESLDLVLASTSPYRRELLSRLGLPFRCVAPRFDEAEFQVQAHTRVMSPRALAACLARGKAASVAELEPAATVIGCDQLVAFEGKVFGKPGSPEAAIDQLLAMSGQTHELITALAVLDPRRSIEGLDVTRMQMRTLTRAEIERYVAADRPVDCAGAYRIEARGIVLFERIESADQTAITGLPLIRLTTALRGLGFPVP